MKKRTAIRIGSYLATLVAVLGIYAYTGYQRADYYQHQLENNYQQSLTELNEYMSTIETTLEKSIYATTPSMVSEISMSLWRECSGAKSAMAKLPLSSLNLENTYKFLSQVGDFAMNLSNKLAGGNEISEEEHGTLVQFAQYAKDFSDTVDRMVALYSNGEYISGSGTIALNSDVQSEGQETAAAQRKRRWTIIPTYSMTAP
ncbi:MAG: germination protein YpeB [Clostridiales bacterium]|nr:germination protein YpeB [Clostridiales bacterium]